MNLKTTMHETMHEDALNLQPPTPPSQGHVHPTGTDTTHEGTHKKGHTVSTHGNPNPAGHPKGHV